MLCTQRQVINAILAFTLSVQFSKPGNGAASTAVRSDVQRVQQLLVSSGAEFLPKPRLVCEEAQEGKENPERARSAGRSLLASAASRVLPTIGDA